ncbi:Hsp70 family protein [Dongia sp.]|uniref:Hsp70 family protein n=1 Tax=Dongia sp. TaxID=1977262 RepID=UPI003752BEC9
MYLGIDLGTSNSAIVGNSGSDLRLFKTAEGTDVLPSVININKTGHRFVGNRAYQQALLSPENVAQGFKRLMGTDSPIGFAAAKLTMTPEECSTEIIRTLLSQTKTEVGDVSIDGTIVTIPAAFNQMQSEATLRAAAAAGLEKVGLLQEPIAAAMASIAHSKNKNGQFLVYDLGGGTFDVALVQSIGGSVNVVAHEGINMLGGRDFDRMIVNSIVRPWLLEQFDLPADFQTNPKYRRLIGVARAAAEKAKIELSSADRAIVFAGEEETRVQDEQGEDVYLSVDVSRAQIEDLIAEQIADSVSLCRKVIKDNGYSSEDIDRIVLIGGPSKMPWIRTRIPAELGIPADLQTDPMTAVAIGAAIFAESREWTSKATTRKASRGTSTTRGEIEVRYDFPARTSDDRARIRVRPAGTPSGYRLQIDTTDGWSSGVVDLASDTSIEVPLTQRGENQCRVTIYDPSGAPAPGASTVLTITRTHASAAGIPATQTISVKVVDKIGGAERNSLAALVKKGTPLPAEGTQSFRAAVDLRGGEPGEIAIELYQQRDDRVSDPELNLFVGSFVLKAQDDLERSEILRKGEEVIIRWSMDDNGLLNCSIDVPSLGKSFDTGKFYVSATGHRNFEGSDGETLAASVLQQAEDDLDLAEDVIGDKQAIEDLKRRLDRQKEALSQSVEADVRRSATEEARAVRQQVSILKHSPENQGKVLQQDLDAFKTSFDATIREAADPRMTEIVDRLAGTAQAAIRASRFDEAERALQEMRSLAHRELMRMPSYLIHLFRDLAARKHLAIDKAKHASLSTRGEAALASNDMDSLRRVIFEMIPNLFLVDTDTGNVAALAGLMRA